MKILDVIIKYQHIKDNFKVQAYKISRQTLVFCLQ